MSFLGQVYNQNQFAVHCFSIFMTETLKVDTTYDLEACIILILMKYLELTETGSSITGPVIISHSIHLNTNPRNISRPESMN